MNSRYLPSERLVALFLLAVLLLNPPLLLIFDSPSSVAAIPSLYVYLFAVWAVLIGLLALITEFSAFDDEDVARQQDAHRDEDDRNPERG